MLALFLVPFVLKVTPMTIQVRLALLRMGGERGHYCSVKFCWRSSVSVELHTVQHPTLHLISLVTVELCHDCDIADDIIMECDIAFFI